jgi:hypothetical protein
MQDLHDCQQFSVFSSNACDFQDAPLTAAPHTFVMTALTTGGRKARDLSSSCPFSTTSTQLAQSDTILAPYTPKCQGKPAVPALETLYNLESKWLIHMLGPDKKVQVPSGSGCHQTLA